MTTKLPISVCIIAKNEERYIEDCLRSLIPYNMEIVVVDTGSTDNTKRLALKYTDKVYDFEWVEDFAAARNFAASKATNNWILVLDCDERVREFDVMQIRRCMQQHLRHVGIMNIKSIMSANDGDKTYSADEVPRFYNKNFFDYRFRIHEQITPKNQIDLNEVKLYTFALPMVVEHLGYDISPEEMKLKQQRNLRLLCETLGTTPFDDYIYFQMGQSYQILEDYENAQKCYQACIGLVDDLNKAFVKTAILNYGWVLELQNKYDMALKHLLNYEAEFDSAEFEYMLGCAYDGTGDNLKALLTLVKVTQMSDIDKLGDKAYDVYLRIMKLHTIFGNADGVDHFRERLLEYGLMHGRKIEIV